MSAPQFTPAPWLVHSTNRLIVKADEAFDAVEVKDGKVVGDGTMPHSICLLRDPGVGFSEDETLANGFLIAAAPELYALLVVLEWGDDERPGCPFCGMGKETGHLERCQLADALAKARGEQS